MDYSKIMKKVTLQKDMDKFDKLYKIGNYKKVKQSKEHG